MAFNSCISATINLVSETLTLSDERRVTIKNYFFFYTSGKSKIRHQQTVESVFFNNEFGLFTNTCAVMIMFLGNIIVV